MLSVWRRPAACSCKPPLPEETLAGAELADRFHLGDSSKANTSKFSAMRSGLTDFGMTTMPRGSQRRTSCPTPFPRRAAIL